ncbi:MAG: hypothetical protein R3B60_00425 [Candidatus Paceibacterota bacterium]
MDYSVFDSLQMAFAEMWGEVINFLPSIAVAVVVLIIGAIIASALKRLTERISKKVGLDSALDAAGVDDITEKAGYKLSAGVFIGTLVKWFILLVFFIVALDILHLEEVTVFLRDVVIGYLPKVIIAVLILMVAAIIANTVRNMVIASTKLAGMNRPELFGKVAYVAIITVAVLAALNQLDIATELIQPLFTGIVFAISLALGLAFGLGGKDAASRVIDSVTRR